MGYFTRVSSVATPTRLRAQSVEHPDPFHGLYGAYMPPLWASSLSAAGIRVTPELALTLSSFYSGVTTIGMDLSTLPAQVLKNRDDGGKDRVRGGASAAGTGGIGSLAYMLRWAPNQYQTATEFFLGMIAQWLMRGRAYAEIVHGQEGFLQQLLPRHPDRILTERLPTGRLRHRLTEADGSFRYVTQDEMHVVRDLSLDGGITPVARVQYGANAIGLALAAQGAASKFFKSGMTAAMLATYTGGEMEDEDEASLHASIMRYASGVENSFGLMLVPDDVKVTNLAVEPEKAQMMLAQEWGVREVARLLRMPGHKLGIKDAVSYNSQIQGALDYVIGCLRPIAVTFEQAIQRDLVLAKDTYVIEFKLEALMRGDFESQSKYIKDFIASRVMWPSEARAILNMNPDERLDKLSEQDHRAGSSRDGAGGGRGNEARTGHVGHVKATLVMHDNALRVLRREREAVSKLAKRHASEPAAWQAGLREFYAEHAGFVAQVMRLRPDTARDYAATHGAELEAKGVVWMTEDWERYEAEELTALALEPMQAAA